MNEFLGKIKVEFQRQNYLKQTCEKKLKAAPKGYLTIRGRKKEKSYYWNIGATKKGERGWKQINITANLPLQIQLIEKKINRERKRRAIKNLRLLEKMEKEYQPMDMTDIEATISPQFKEVLIQRRNQQVQAIINAPYRKCSFNPEFHKHDTDCGIMVRSKSEKIIVNTLVAYGIPFHYEQEFEYAGSKYRRIYPDFTIFLPNGEIIIWEHLGLLAHEGYCLENAKKLNIYQQSGFTIGENLILTMDNSKGDLSSARINNIIKNDILPYFQ